MKLLEQVENRLICKGSPITTRRTYKHWIERYFRFILRQYGRNCHPKNMSARVVEEWLADMAKGNRIAPTTQDVALQSVLFLYREILKIDLVGIDALRSSKPKRIPTVLTIDELGRIFKQMNRVPSLVAKIQTGCGLRIGEAVSLRIKDIDFDREQITVRRGKGAKDRITVFPAGLHDEVRRQIDSMEVLYRNDRSGNMPGVSMPDGLGSKFKNAAKDWIWFYLFASENFSRHPDTKELARHHVDASNINRAMSAAARTARIPKRVTSHAFRHSFASHMLSIGTPIIDIAEMMGHSDIRTTQIYLHCNMASGKIQRNPFESILSIKDQKLAG